MILQTTSFPVSILSTGDVSPWQSELTIRHKNDWVSKPNKFKGDLPPVIIPERDGKILAIIQAPNIDKSMAYEAAAVVRKSIDVDAFSVITDGHMPLGKQRDVPYRRGDMQRACDEENACERGLYTDCMVITYVGKRKWVKCHSYSYDGKKDGSRVRWTPQHDFDTRLVVKEESAVGGDVVETIENIIRSPVDFSITKDMAEFFGLNDPRRISIYDKKRILKSLAISYLKSREFLVWDFTDEPIQM